MARLVPACTAAWLLLVAGPGPAQAPGGGPAPVWQTTAPEPLYQFAEGRRGMSLSGDWETLVDPLSVGDRPSATGLGGNEVYRARPAPEGLRFAEFVFSPSQTLKVPGDWNSQDRRLDLYEGPVWYLRRLTLEAPLVGRRILQIGSANYRTDVYVNGDLVARHEGGFTPFSVDVTRSLKGGANAIVLKVDNRLGTKTVPTRFSDWWNHGGVTGDVRLLELPAARLVSWRVQLKNARSRDVEILVEASAEAAGRTVTVALPGVGEVHSARIAPDGTAQLGWRTRAGLWSPETPLLHDLRLSIDGGETVTDQVGFRTIEARDGDLLLNGKHIILRGISAHAVSPLHPGRATGTADAAAMLGEVKALGGNFIRLAHYPHDEAVVRLADRMGIMVWSELPVYWAVDFGDPAVIGSVRRQAVAMVARDRNRASVILWSIANETPNTPARLTFLQQVAADIRAKDGSRPLTAALLVDTARYAKSLSRTLAARLILDARTPPDERARLSAWFEKAAGAPLDGAMLRTAASPEPLLIDDPLAASLDVASVNQYFGWYYASFLARAIPADEDRLARAILDLMPEIRFVPPNGKPFLVSEFGAEAKIGLPGGADRMFTEAYQAEVYRRQLDMLARQPGIDGVSPWVLQDFRSPLRPYPGVQDGFNRKGITDETGRRKLAFDVLRQAYLSGWPHQ